tara:strand:+ start:242 stop:550 length:309 start_codon:yes stop_codon:yes gene_type:complete
MKYVMLRSEHGGHHAILFHDRLTHSIVAHGVVREYRRNGEFYNIVSAGFYDDENKVSHGESESLNLKSEPYDAAYIFLGDSVSLVPTNEVMGLLAQLKRMMT